MVCEVIEELLTAPPHASAEEFIQYSLSAEGKPAEIPLNGHDYPNKAYLDPRCWPYCDSFLSDLPRTLDRLATSSLCSELSSGLEEAFAMTKSRTVVLSLSGGVDSSSTLILLCALRYHRVADWKLRALYMGYSGNRENLDEARSELNLVAWLCEQCNVQLFAFNIDLPRPHGLEGTTSGGVTRDEYETQTKSIRFRMYSLASGDENCVVVLGHHQDDVDENRLEQLSRGHVMGDMDGMHRVRESPPGLDRCIVCRPLIYERKSTFVKVATEAHIPYVHDSTPAWSVRGITRKALDAVLLDDNTTAMHQILADVACMSSRAAELIVSVANSGVMEPRELRSKSKGTCLTFWRVDLLRIFSHEDLANLLPKLISSINDVAKLWNRALPSDQNAVRKIPQVKDWHSVVFERVVSICIERMLPGERVSRKALLHLFREVSSTGVRCGGFTETLGFVSDGGRKVMLLYVIDKANNTVKDRRQEVIKLLD
ncbi:hypothetical protein Pmar_PMAR018210 [Perkinsus marinus ATCC 50983]|uniref:tRNA(Ile)-lysidine synthetase n=1 Tax=Perkinsus marinus (strain ATCC 50983 / TXsc) TaxID=423536 RepID=C5KZ59_PERM5|nr:hypothetical protein Pmar_PMAR018210 [Perkinsus marinus ATCC 50983]EER10209.1 hypothetical protein Pmar_PMAR018210 [Perkinsus marinus ATCC 50983]|eukprot:XP_002778414.1 hypothetical protein Pmar_PMAR018210 [Perkinsus marinus ATCC 50983]